MEIPNPGLNSSRVQTEGGLVYRASPTYTFATEPNCMRFAIPPRQLRLGGWRLGARGARFLLFGVIGGLCGVLGDPLVCLGVPGGSL